jgi:hypothetical protein
LLDETRRMRDIHLFFYLTVEKGGLHIEMMNLPLFTCSCKTREIDGLGE